LELLDPEFTAQCAERKNIEWFSEDVRDLTSRICVDESEHLLFYEVIDKMIAYINVLGTPMMARVVHYLDGALIVLMERDGCGDGSTHLTNGLFYVQTLLCHGAQNHKFCLGCRENDAT
jgi:hypothetical protein